jgi:hypothetical protein
MARNGFKKLINNIKKNELYQDENGEYTKMSSSVNLRKYLNGKETANSKEWVPPKVKITEEDLVKVWNKQNGKCHYWNVDLDMDLLFPESSNFIPNHPLAPSVDRIDNNKDYTLENIVICTRFANIGRGSFPYEEMKLVVDHLKKSDYQVII